jgi:hypothetical protein
MVAEVVTAKYLRNTIESLKLFAQTIGFIDSLRVVLGESFHKFGSLLRIALQNFDLLIATVEHLHQSSCTTRHLI